MPRKKQEVVVVAVTPVEAVQVAPPQANGHTETVSGYFRRVIAEKPALLHERTNDAIYARWVADHPGHTEVPKTVKANLQNLKSVLRKQQGLSVPKAEPKTVAQPVVAAPAPIRATKPKAAGLSLDRLEGMIDECLFTVREMEVEGLQRTAALLREARNALIRQAGVAG